MLPVGGAASYQVCGARALQDSLIRPFAYQVVIVRAQIEN
jgi:hypothetical protein